MSKRVRLCRAYSFRAAWDKAAAPWIESAVQNAWKLPPPAILVPSMTYAQFLKSQLLASGAGIMGINILTHTQCWKKLRDHFVPDAVVADRTDLHLLLSSVAEQFPALPSAQSIARDPSQLMRAIDQTAASGWSFDDLKLPELKPIYDKFLSTLSQAGMTTAQEAEKIFLRKSASAERAPLFSSLLVIGFDGAHWPIWTMLNSAVNAADDAVVCLFEPRATAEPIDQAWIASWEESRGEAEILAGDEDDNRYAPLALALENAAPCAAKSIPRILIGEDLQEHAAAIAAQTLEFLADDACSRVGIVFTGQSPLARQTARLLTRWNIPHNDTIAHYAPHAPADTAWLAWLAMQEKRGARELLEFLRLCPEAAKSADLDFDRMRYALEDAYNDLLSDDIRLLDEFADLKLTDKIALLPDTATFGKFMEATALALARFPFMAGEGRLTSLRQEHARFASGWDAPVSRNSFITWLRDKTGVHRRVKDDPGKHHFARVHLVPYDKSEWQSWSHLILTGLNSDNWPPPFFNSPFLPQEIIDDLNRRSLAEPSSGEGQKVIKKGKSLIIGPAERSSHVKRQFYNLIESAQESLCLTAGRTREDKPGTRWPPGDFLARVHAIVAGEGLSDEKMDALQSATAKWLDESALFTKTRAAEIAGVEATMQAYRSRRDHTRPFGRYEFALDTPPVSPVVLQCSAVGAMIDRPELAWLSYFLGVDDTEWDTGEMPWLKTRGLWVHKWLRSALTPAGAEKHAFFELAPPSRMHAELLKSAMETRARAEKVFQSVLGFVPEWWIHFHAQSQAVAVQIMNDLAGILPQGWKTAAAEWRLPDDAKVELAGKALLRIRGRIDLILSKNAGVSGAMPANLDSCFVIDYKTGQRAGLKACDVADGKSLQIFLYALALRTLGTRGIAMALAGPGGDIGNVVEPDALLDDPDVTAMLCEISRMQETGIFGMGTHLEDEYGHQPAYPIAMLAVNPAILADKRKLTLERRLFKKTE